MSPPTLRELIRGLPVDGGEADARPVSDVTHDSRRVSPGAVFVAVPGEHHDGRDFALEAAAAGAVAVVGRGEEPPGLPVPWLAAADPRALLGPLAARVHLRPDRQLTLVGITGTNGKSTVALLTRAVLEAAGRPAGLLGSLVYRFGEWSEKAARTTPEASDLLRLLRDMADEGARAAALEVSSHALELGRVSELTFDVAVFTNLTPDHLDFHGTLDAYFAAKARLFDQLKEEQHAGPRPGTAVVCLDDPRGRRLARRLHRRGTPVLGYGLQEPGAWEGVPGEEPDGLEAVPRVGARDLEITETGLALTALTPRGELALTSPLLGRFNAGNLLAAVAVAEALELPHTAVAEGLARQGPVPGRMEPVDRGQPFPVYVDYSHTEAALEAALRSVAELTRRKVIVVFGCGGDRDPSKRRPMGRLAGELADLPIVTSDNPRSEDPMAIIRQVEEGLKDSGNPHYRVMPDRREAIRRAIAVAGPESAVLVAGKGAEAVQVVGDEERQFFDREEIEQALEERFGSQKLD